MKFCPYCGAAFQDEEVAFCTECGKSIPEKAGAMKQSSGKQKKKASVKKKPKRKPASIPDPVKENPPDDDYDGYYEDIVPTDAGETRQALDKAIVKKISLLVIGVLVVVGACVAIMYLL